MIQETKQTERSNRGGLKRLAELVGDQQNPEIGADLADGPQGREDVARGEQGFFVEREPAPAERFEGVRESAGDLIEVPDEDPDVGVLTEKVGQADGVVRQN